MKLATSAVLLTSALMTALAGATGAGCAEAPSDGLGTTTPAASSATGAGVGGGDAATPNQGQAMFAALEGDFAAACGACHEAGGIADTPFLALPDRYTSVVSWPGLVSKDPSQSLLLTYAVAGGGHSGKNLDSAELTDTLEPAIEAWLAEEAKGIADPVAETGPSIEPFVPKLGSINVVYLDALGAELGGTAIVFSAEALTDSTLSLTNLQVFASANMGVHMVHPLFVVFPKGGEADPDPVDSMSNVDQTYDVGTVGDLGPGTVILTNWRPDARLSIAFETIEAYTSEPGTGGGGGGGPNGGCVDVDAFVENAQGPLGTCANCHGGSNGQATAAVDMSDLESDPASACAQVKNRINPANPNASQIFVTTDPDGGATHPFKFNGSDAAWNDFRDALVPWITAEQ